MVDLSELAKDGGGTQYTFLDAIYHDCAIVLNRKWMEMRDTATLEKDTIAMPFQAKRAGPSS
jgi:hypothetical protein